MDISALSSKYMVRRMTAEDTDIIYKLSLGNPMYFQYCPPFVTKERIEEDLIALPPKKSYDDKYYAGFFEESKLIAVMDLVFSYPNEKTAFIGYFMMCKEKQGNGIGSEIISECMNFLKRKGYLYARLAIAKGNPQSEAFWSKNRFSKLGIEVDKGEYIAVVMERTLI